MACGQRSFAGIVASSVLLVQGPMQKETERAATRATAGRRIGVGIRRTIETTTLASASPSMPRPHPRTTDGGSVTLGGGCEVASVLECSRTGAAGRQPT